MDFLEAIEEDPLFFDDDFVEYLERAGEEESAEVGRACVPKRYARDLRNPLEVYDDMNFKKRYRFFKDPVVNFILPKISPPLDTANNRGLPMPPLHQLLVALRFYATGSFQMMCGDLAYVAQSSVSRILVKVTNLLAALLPDFVRFPRNEREWRLHREAFEQLSSRPARGNDSGHRRIPNLDGAIDCTHVRLIPIVGQDSQRYSEIGKVVVGPRGEFLDIVSRWAGSEHDSRVFQNSRVNARYRSGELNGYLLRDGGYPCLPYLLIPIRNPQGRAEERFNLAQIKGRNVVERTFGCWKRRFPCLSNGLGTKLQTSSTVIVACAVLHNMSKIVDGAMPDDLPEIEEREQQIEEPAWIDFPPGEGIAVRNREIQAYFT